MPRKRPAAWLPARRARRRRTSGRRRARRRPRLLCPGPTLALCMPGSPAPLRPGPVLAHGPRLASLLARRAAGREPGRGGARRLPGLFRLRLRHGWVCSGQESCSRSLFGVRSGQRAAPKVASGNCGWDRRMPLWPPLSCCLQAATAGQEAARQSRRAAAARPFPPPLACPFPCPLPRRHRAGGGRRWHHPAHGRAAGARGAGSAGRGGALGPAARWADGCLEVPPCLAAAALPHCCYCAHRCRCRTPMSSRCDALGDGQLSALRRPAPDARGQAAAGERRGAPAAATAGAAWG